MESVVLLASFNRGFSNRSSRPLLAFVGCAIWSGYIGAIEPEPLPDFDCVIEPSEIVDLGSAVPGIIDMIYARRSDTVEKGVIVATLDSSVANANAILAKVRADLTTSISLREESAAFGNRTSERNRALYQKKAISKQEIDKLDTENRIAQLQVRQEKDNKTIADLTYDRAKAVLERHSIRSPISGVVMEGYKAVGEYIEDDPVMRIAQIDPLHVEVILPVKYLGRVLPGRRAEITPGVPGYRPQIATVSRVDKVADAASGTFGARLVLPNSDHSIAGGLRCNLAFLPVEHSAVEPSPLALSGQQLSSKEISIQSNLVAEMEAQASDVQMSVQQSVVVDSFEPAIQMTSARDCYRVGPLANAVMTDSLSDTISKMDDASEPQHVEAYPLNAGYQVFVAFQQDQAPPVNIQEYLGGKGIKDFYRISSAEDEVRVSVGFFGNELNAMAYQESLAEADVKAGLLAVLRNSSWLNLSFDSGQTAQQELARLVKQIAPAASVKLTQCSE
ncbi:MAG: RND family efflux transporter MFP subunit [Candidatus Azotimanducaceae bacterium]|jgi:RND family efflux transporter MFP subunit